MASLLYDVMGKSYLIPNPQPWRRHMQEAIKHAVVFKIDNVADYYWRAGRDDWRIERDYPNLAPPYPLMWLEYALPKEVFTENGVIAIPDSLQGKRRAYLIRAVEGGPFPEVHWSLSVYTLFETQADASVPGIETVEGKYYIGLTDHGQVARGADGQLLHGIDWDGEFTQSAEVEEFLRKQENLLHPVYLALSFMHCKNVELVEQGGERQNPQTGKRIRPRHGARSKHYTIQIEAMKKVLRHEGESEPKGLKHALSVCRGHFKYFGPAEVSGHPQGVDTGLLFGKYAGVYWWESQVRLAPGEKPPTYVVNPPKEAADDADAGAQDDSQKLAA